MPKTSLAPAPKRVTVPALGNYERAKEFYGILLDAYWKKLPPYDKRLVQEDHNLPAGLKWGSRDHAYILFHMCYWMKGGIKSETAIRYVSKLWVRHPKLFNAERFLKMSKVDEELAIEDVQKILMANGLGANATEVGRQWVKNAQKLAKFWNSDPRKLFAHMQTQPSGDRWTFEEAKANYEEICKVIIRPKVSAKKWDPLKGPNGFFGFQHKMVSMLMYFYIHAGILPRVPYPVPVDIHVQRIHASNEAIYPERLLAETFLKVSQTAALLRDMTLRYCVEFDVLPEHLADVLWYLSNSWCVRHPDNASSKGPYMARRTRVLPKKFKWTKNRRETYARTCGRCPILATCVQSVPSGPYYSWGVLMLRGEKSAPDLFGQAKVAVPYKQPEAKTPRPERILPVLHEHQELLFK